MPIGPRFASFVYCVLFVCVLYCVLQGAENDIRAKFYSMAFQQQYLEDESIVKWKLVDFEFAGDIPYT